jgi:hypothetical protein
VSTAPTSSVNEQACTEGNFEICSINSYEVQLRHKDASYARTTADNWPLQFRYWIPSAFAASFIIPAFSASGVICWTASTVTFTMLLHFTLHLLMLPQFLVQHSKMMAV